MNLARVLVIGVSAPLGDVCERFMAIAQHACVPAALGELWIDDAVAVAYSLRLFEDLLP